MRWIELGLGVPPMRFDHVMEGVVADGGIKTELQALVERKRHGEEKMNFVPPSSTERYIDDLIQNLSMPDAQVTGRQKADLDSVFRETIG
jgi:predicted nucleotidyltransferase